MEEKKCVHCGAGCGRNPVLWEGQAFCCHGCKTVYHILNEKKLHQYYEIQPMSGIRIERPQEIKAFAFLDNTEIRDKLLYFSDGSVSSVRLFIPGIHCASCIWLLEHLQTLHPGILHSNVHFPKKQVNITFNHAQITLRQVAELLTSIHYIPEITLDDLEAVKPGSPRRGLLLKIGIASFSFLNIMMYSFPEYVPGGHLLEQEFRHLFGWLSFILILPVIFYSATDYYISAWKGLRHGIISIDLPITLGIIALFLQSSWVVFSGQGIGYMDSLAGLLFFLLVGKWYQGKTYEALSFERDYKSYFPVAVTKLEEGKELITPIKDLRTGDRIMIRNQELIPADAQLIEGNGNIDYSFVTGEALPVRKNAGDFIYAGGRQVGSTIILEVEKAVEQSYLTQLWNQHQDSKQQGRLNNLTNQISRYFTLIILAIAFGAFTYWVIADSLATAVYVFASVLIIACPCALALTVPFTFGSTMRLFGRMGFYIKKAEVIETLNEVDTVVFDKTGTITMNREVEIHFVGKDPGSEEQTLIRSVLRHSSHPLSTVLYAHLKDAPLIACEQYDEIPGMGITASLNGHRVNIGSALFVTGQAESEQTAASRVYVGIDGQSLGYYSIGNQYREGLEMLVRELRPRYALHLISGDNDAERERLQKFFGNDAQLHFNQTPTGKRDYIQDLMLSGHKVLMIGDGLNDAGALAQSHAGISVADDVFSFSPASDAILESSQFFRLGTFLGFTKKSMRIIRQSFLISFIYNIIGLSFSVSAMLSPLIAAILMPLSSVSIVAFTTFSVMLAGRRWFPVNSR